MTHRRIVVIMSDSHAGHRLGLLAPGVTLHDESENGQLVEYQPEPTAFQSWLWEQYEGWLGEISAWAAGDEMIVYHNGDLTQGVKFAEQLVTTRQADQVLIAMGNLAPWLELPNVTTFRMIAGTNGHVFGEASSEILAARWLRDKYPGKDIEVMYHSLAEVDGCLLDISHHGPNQSSRVWLSGNMARYYTSDAVMRSLLKGETPVNVYVRSHVHTPVSEAVTVEGHEARIVITPPLCGLGDYARKATRSISSISVGLAAIQIIDGEPTKPKMFTKSIDIRTKEIL